jgi:hypothetical protein
MANYVPHYQKRRYRREQLEHVLVRLLGHGAPAEDIADAVEAVRQARLRELVARRAQLHPTPQSAAELAKLEGHMAAWSTMPPEAIIESCLRRE